MKITRRQLRKTINEIMGPGEKRAAGMSSGGVLDSKFNSKGFIKDPISFTDFLHTTLAASSIVDPTMLSDIIDSLVYYLQGKKKEAALVLALSVGGLGAGALAVKGMKAVKASKAAKEIPSDKIAGFGETVGKQADEIISETQAKLGEENAKEFLNYYREILEKKQDYDIDYDEFVKLRDKYFEKMGKEGASQIGTKSAKVFAQMNVGETFTTTEKMYAYVALPSNLKKGTKLKPTPRGKGDNEMDMIEREIEVWRKTNAPDKASRIDCFYASWRPDGGSWVNPKGSRNTVYMIEIQPGTKISMYNGNSFSDSIHYVRPHATGKSSGKYRSGSYGTGDTKAYKGSDKAKSYDDDMDALEEYFGTGKNSASPANDYGFSGSDHHELVMNGPAPIIVKQVDKILKETKIKITRQTLRKLINEVYKDYESQKQGERARLNIPGLAPKLSSIESSGEYTDELQANQLALAMGSKESELPTEIFKFNLKFEMVKNKARAYLQSTLDYCEWVNSSEERFTPEDKATLKNFHQRSYDLGQEYVKALYGLHKKLGKLKKIDPLDGPFGSVTFGNPEQHELYLKLNDYITRPFDDHSSLIADIAKEEPKYAWMGRPVKPGKCQDMYMYRKFGPRKY